MCDYGHLLLMVSEHIHMTSLGIALEHTIASMVFLFAPLSSKRQYKPHSAATNLLQHCVVYALFVSEFHLYAHREYIAVIASCVHCVIQVGNGAFNLLVENLFAIVYNCNFFVKIQHLVVKMDGYM